MHTKYLSSAERKEGIKQYVKFATVNGIGFSFIGETVVYLMAIYFGATNTQLGYIGSSLHLTGIITAFLPILFANVNMKDLFFRVWLLRGIVCFLYAFVFLLSGQNAVFLILVVFTLFNLLRNIGVAIQTALQKTLASPTEMGNLLAKISSRFAAMGIISQVLSFFLLSLSFFSGIGGLIILEYTGAILNTIGSFYIRKIPCREKLESPSTFATLSVFMEAMRNKNSRLAFIIRWLSLSSTILMGFIVPFLRRESNLESSTIFIYTIITALSVITANIFLKPFIFKMGRKPVIIISYILFSASSAFWALVPGQTSIIILFIAGAVIGFLGHIAGQSVAALVLNVMPDDNKASFAAALSSSVAIVALIIGPGGGLLADISTSLPFSVPNIYTLPFLFSTALTLCLVVLAAFIKDSGSMNVLDSAKIIFSIKNLRDLFDIYTFTTTDDKRKQETILFGLGRSNTNLATDEFKRLIKRPLLPNRAQLLYSLYFNKKEELVDTLIEEIKNERDKTIAIFALGAYPSAKVKNFLTKIFFEDDDDNTKVCAAKSLVRIGEKRVVPSVKKIIKKKTLNTSGKLDAILALSLGDEEGTYLPYIFKIINRKDKRWAREVAFSIVGRQINFDPPLEEIYAIEANNFGEGFEFLLDEAKQVTVFLDNRDKLLDAYKQKNFALTVDFCKQTVSSLNLIGFNSNIQKAILNAPQNPCLVSSICVLYLTYYLESNL